MKVKSVVLITPGQPSTNPRLVKEADALVDAGYRVTVLYAYWTGWAAEADRSVLAGRKWRSLLVGGSPQAHQRTHLFTRIRHKLFTLLLRKTGFRGLLPEYAACRAFAELLAAARKERADLYIAHNLAALPIAALAAQYHGTRFAFDAEDYHRGQAAAESLDYQLACYLENKYLDKAAYLTAASPLIAQAYKAHYPGSNPVVINNVFPLNQQPAYQEPTHQENAKPLMPLRLFWFSQSIGKNRGLEDVVRAVGSLHNPGIEIHLLGLVGDEEKRYFEEYAARAGLEKNQLHFILPVAPDVLIQVAAAYDIGLALEIPHCANRDICLTNKLFTYVLAGNAVIASNTSAQGLFMQQYPRVGKLYQSGDTAQLAQLIRSYYENPAFLHNDRKEAWLLGRAQLNWDVEQQYFLQVIESVLAPIHQKVTPHNA